MGRSREQNSRITWRHIPQGEMGDGTSLFVLGMSTLEVKGKKIQHPYVTTAKPTNDLTPSLYGHQYEIC